MVKSIQRLSLQAVYPSVPAEINLNLNTCGDPDCGNYGLSPDFSLPAFRGRNACQRRQAAAMRLTAVASGSGSYALVGNDKNKRISQVFEYADEPVSWEDGRSIICDHQRENGRCGITFNVLSNEHFLEELDRLQTVNGLLMGPVCGACGTRYLDRPDEFVFNGTHGTMRAGGNRRKAKPSGFRIIHRPCKGKSGARTSVSLDHQAQQVQRDNVRILRALVNGASINDLRRLLADPDTGKQIGVSRIYNRIFWLEKTLLAFERAKLREWKSGVEASDRFSHMRIAHDDVTISVNWESRADRRLTPLQFSVSADIRSGYVFRIDANFDPRVDAVELVERNYVGSDGQPINIRRTYTQASRKTFTAPALSFQRPTGRFDEAMLFASAEGSWGVFTDRLERAHADQITMGLALPPEVQAAIDHATARRALLDDLRQGYFGLQEAIPKEKKEVGFTTYSPNFYYDNSSITAIYTADMASIEKLIPAEVRAVVSPISFAPGKGLVAITSYAYHYCDNDSYNELSISVVTTRPDQRNLGLISLMGQLKDESLWGYVLKLPVDTELARVRGVVGYNLPKWKIPIDYSAEADAVAFTYYDEAGKVDFSMTGKKLDTTGSTPAVSRVNFVNLDAQGTVTHGFSDIRAVERASSRAGDDVQLGLSDGPMSTFIRSLGLERLVRYDYQPLFQAALYTPEPV